MALEVAIIGGGIGGLAMGLAARKAGLRFHVYEQAPALREVGAGIALWPNVMRTLRSLGVGAELEAMTTPLRWMVGQAADGRELTRMDAAAVLGAPELGPRIVHRAELLAVFAKALGAECVTTSARAVSVRGEGGRARVEFEDGRSVEADVVIGADGMHSRVRPFVVQDAPRSARQVCYRGLVEHAVEAPDTITEIQGAGLRGAVCPLGPRRVYWWACEPEREAVPEGQRRARVLELFKGFPREFVRCVEATAEAQVLFNALADRVPVRTWHRERVVLLGDAAHPTTPNLGQGANMAIDDALALARALRDEASVEAAFARYERERVGRARHIVTLSRRFGEVAGWANPVAVAMREWGLRMTPRGVMEREVRRQLEEHVGEL